MAKGSEQFAWKRYGDLPRVCAACGKALRVVDVGQINTSYDTHGVGTTVFYCVDHSYGRAD